jgi:hypothetical protein
LVLAEIIAVFQFLDWLSGMLVKVGQAEGQA